MRPRESIVPIKDDCSAQRVLTPMDDEHRTKQAVVERPPRIRGSISHSQRLTLLPILNHMISRAQPNQGTGLTNLTAQNRTHLAD